MRWTIIFGLLCFTPLYAFAQEPATTPQSIDRATAEAQLAEREAQLKTLQSDITRLRESLGIGETMLRVEATIIELSHDSLRKSGFDPKDKSVLYSFMEGAENHDPDTIPVVAIEPGSRLMKQIDGWVSDPEKPAKVLASPKLLTTFGEPATMQIGSEFPIIVPGPNGTMMTEYRLIGTRLEVIGKLRDDGDIDLLVRPRHNEFDETQIAMIDGQRIPGLLVKECEKRIKMSPHGKVVLGGKVQSRSTPKKPARLLQKPENVVRQSELIVVLTVDLMKQGPTEPTPELKDAAPRTASPAR